MKFNHKAQSIVEYILVMTGLVILIMAATVGIPFSATGLLEGGVQSGLDTIHQKIDNDLSLDFTGEVVDLENEPLNQGDPDLRENLGFQEANSRDYYFHEGESTYIGGMPVEDIPAPGTITKIDSDPVWD